MSDIAQLTQGEKDAALARVSEFGRFSKMMEDCKSDELGVRVQKSSKQERYSSEQNDERVAQYAC